MRKTISIILTCFLLGLISGFLIKRQAKGKPDVIIRVDTIRDTTIVPHIVPSERIITIHDTITQYIINKDTISLTDTIYRDVKIPTYNYTFKNDDAKVIVNGFGVKLNSFETYRHTKIITKKPKWSLGLGIGYGFSQNGAQPCVVISVNRTLLSW